MKPTPSPFKKFLLPGVIIIGLVLVGVLLFMKGGAVDQGAALFNATTKTASIKTGITGTLNPNTQPLLCLVGSTVPQIKVMSPNGGETFTAGQQITVKWSTCNAPATEQIMISLKANYSGAEIATVPNTGSATITLPTAMYSGTVPLISGKLYKINLQLGGNAMGHVAPTDESDNLFTINSLAAVSFISSYFIPEKFIIPIDGEIGITFKIRADGSNLAVPENVGPFSNTIYTIFGPQNINTTGAHITCSGMIPTGGVFTVMDGTAQVCTLSVKFKGTNTTPGLIKLRLENVAGVAATNIETPFY